MAGVHVTIEFDALPEPEIDDEAITAWIESRLNDARNLFIRNVSRGHGGGRTYRRSRGRIVHKASAPDEYPATDGGRLVGSIAPQMLGPREGALYSNVEYARYLAEGTQHMAPRRMLADAIAEVIENQPRGDVLASAARIR